MAPNFCIGLIAIANVYNLETNQIIGKAYAIIDDKGVIGTPTLFDLQGDVITKKGCYVLQVNEHRLVLLPEGDWTVQ